MLYQNDADRVAHQWQGQLDESLEAGETFWLEGGLSPRTMDNLPALTALAALAHQRSDVTTPGFFVGGDGVLWTAALLSQTTSTAASSPPSLALLYGGADSATYMATLATLSAPSAHTRRRAATGLPVEMQGWLLPASQPGAVPLWSFLPFVLAPQATPDTITATSTPGEAWLPWLTLLVVIGLIITALFV